MTSFTIGQKVFSTKFGTGVIDSIEEMNMGTPADFYIIITDANTSKVFVPVNAKDSFRVISNQDELNDALELLSQDISDLNFSSRQDRVTYFKKQSSAVKLADLMAAIRDLHLTDDKGKVEHSILAKMIETQAAEYADALSIPLDNAIEMIRFKLPVS
jgi:RNA polymerase-interacting CarD/CdnL/TRCF family regulator